MTISTTSSKTVAQGNGATTVFSYPFVIPNISYLFVFLTDNLNNTTLLNPSLYSVTGIGSPNGGTVTYPLTGSPLAVGYSLTIARVVTYQQLTDLVNQSGYYPEVVEDALDYLTMEIQQLAQGTTSGLQTPYSEGPFVAGVDFTDGSTTTLTLAQQYQTPSNVQVHFDGVYQGVDQYSISGHSIIFTAPIPVGTSKVYIVGGIPSFGASTGVTSVALTAPAIFSVSGGPITTAGTLALALATQAKNTVFAGPISGANAAPTFRALGTSDFAGLPISVKDFGAKGDGSTDDMTAIQAAVTACVAAGGGVVYFPPGSYIVSSAITIGDHVCMLGSGRLATVIKTTSATADIFVASGWYVSIKSMGFNSSAARSAGAYVRMSGNFAVIDDFNMDNDFNGIVTTGVNNKVMNGVLLTGVAGSTRIIVSGGDTSQLIANVLIGAQSAPFPAAGIQVQNSAALILSNVNVLTQGIALLLNPTSGNFVDSLYAENCFFDTGSTGISVNPSGTGTVQRCRFANCWTGNNSFNGVAIANSGSGAVSGIHFVSHHAILNTLSGFSVTSGVTDFALVGGEVCANSGHGVFIDAGVTDFNICDATIGTGAGLSANGGYGVAISTGASDRYAVQNNRITGNSSGQILDNGTGTVKFLQGNVGVAGGVGSGTVTAVSVVTANGFAGTVATSTSTPAITLKTSITGLLKGNGTAISAAASGDVDTALGYTPANVAGDTFGGDVDVNGTLRAIGLSAPVSGSGLEMAYSSGSTTSFITSYNRGGSAYLGLNVLALQMTFGAGSEWARFENTNGYLLLGYTSSNGAYRLQVNSQIYATNATIATSDARVKKGIKPLKDGLNIIEKLKPVTFKFKHHKIHEFAKVGQVGFLAQDVSDALEGTSYQDCVVHTNQTEDGENLMGVADTKLIPILVKAIQELRAELEELKGKIHA